MRRILLTWSDRGVSGPRPHFHRPPAAQDEGPVLRLASQPAYRYDEAEILTTPPGEANAQELVAALGAHIPAVRLRVLPAVTDPSDHAQLFSALEPVVADHRGQRGAAVDVLLSAGTPQMQTLWVILVQAGLLPARMLQVIPPVFVPDPHPEPVRVVRLDMDGFPEIRALREEVTRLRAAAAASADRSMIGESAAMQRLRHQLGRVAAVPEVPVLILGETGTGKELVARAIHGASPLREGPFIAESCGALAEGVLESELFGHEKGAFTGAGGRRRGLLEQASGGTLFLDEVGEMPPRVQVLLLRALQEGVVRRVGGDQPVRVQVRVLAATHRDLPGMVAAGTFREDLYYRLCGATLRVPPLRERGGDIELLIAHFLHERGRPALMPAGAALSALRSAPWPGNVRQLRAEVVRWTVFCDQPPALEELDLLPPRQQASPAPAQDTAAAGAEARPLAEVVAAAERTAVQAALRQAQGNKSQAARLLGIDRNTLKRKIAALSLV